QRGALVDARDLRMPVRAAGKRCVKRSRGDRQIVNITPTPEKKARVFQTPFDLREWPIVRQHKRSPYYRPLKFAGRLSFHAFTPSRKSSNWQSTVIALPSIWKPPASDVSGAWDTTCFAKEEASGDSFERCSARSSTFFSISSAE